MCPKEKGYIVPKTKSLKRLKKSVIGRLNPGNTSTERTSEASILDNCNRNSTQYCSAKMPAPTALLRRPEELAEGEEEAVPPPQNC